MPFQLYALWPDITLVIEDDQPVKRACLLKRAADTPLNQGQCRVVGRLGDDRGNGLERQVTALSNGLLRNRADVRIDPRTPARFSYDDARFGEISDRRTDSRPIGSELCCKLPLRGQPLSGLVLLPLDLSLKSLCDA